ncbi:cobaltochelatase subunit CobN [Virgisporangium aliadipatigenens]|uniref:Cobaltochelatase subunit CobN n=1 Tax=Virgisporangium aliadipatigenens TaxID=741659 RepID=A0A8J3YPG3_9ACTN|nr:cobaltochelatase subunit CobN [Virgisporangium aliadipatigenens]GIJ47625.1 cobaltochelatase subunit CobN [Virgisporangium aliadipatigenens]
MTAVLLSTADTDLLAARASGAPWWVANPDRLPLSELPGDADFFVVRLLGGRRAWPDGLDAVLATGRPVIAISGEAVPDAELTSVSTVPAGVVHDAQRYLVEGGPANLLELYRFLSDTVLLTGEGFAPPVSTPAFGALERSTVDGRPTVGIVFYRSHALAGNTAFVETLASAIEAAGGNARPVFVPSLRSVPTELSSLLNGCDALVVTVLAAGGTVAGDASAGGDEDAWSVDALAALDVPVIQALCLTSSRAAWEASDAALSPMDAAMQVAIPEFDGRLISVPLSFKEHGDDGIPRYVADPERAARVAGIALGHARLRHLANADKRIAIVLSSYPTKHSRVGNAVGLDTPASAVALLGAMREAGYDVGDVPTDGDALIHTLIAAGGHDVEWLTEEQLAAAPARVPLADYRVWFEALPEELRENIRTHWGEPPGGLYVDGSDIVLAALRFGNVTLMIQPPRGFGENPIAIYHDPDLPPSHHYLAAYRWLASAVDAVVHLGKHGTLEWLPGKGLGLSASCAPDAVLGDLPLVYPFIVNDPGEGTQAKRRAHATVVDHLVPPMARADTYGEMAKLEQLLDEYATVQALDPDKVPTVRAQIWTLIQAAQLHHDLHQADMPGDDEFDDFVLHVDGYLCEVKDSQIRDGLHVLGGAPAGEARVNLVLSILRANQMWGGRQALPGLRSALANRYGLSEHDLAGSTVDAPEALTSVVDGPARTGADVLDLLETLARRLVVACDERGWATDGVVREVLGDADSTVEGVLRFAADEVVPRLAATTDEITATLHALDGGYVPAGPSGSPTRGLVNVLPTGRNFYSVDPKAIPSRNAWDVGQALADSLLARHRADTGEWPRTVGLTVWGTSAMRTQGDDIAEVLALLGCRPVWDDASRRVTGFEIVPSHELGRPRVDVTIRISGFFRDAFPHVVTLLDDAIAAVAKLDEPDSDNHVAAHARADLAEHGDWRRATTRVFGSKPGAYGAGLLPLIDARNWRDDRDLAEVYAVWGGYAYGRDLDGRAARDDLERVYKRISVAAKNVDTREHDIADADDYFQYHGGMVAMVRALTGRNPQAVIGDSHRPEDVRTRTLAEETARVFRARVVNPRWITAMRRHGYKGAFELAATVDYLFGYDATAGVVQDWMYEKLAESYVFDQETREFLETSNPWALRGMTERLLEAAERGLWESPRQSTLDGLRQAYLATEGDLEDR